MKNNKVKSIVLLLLSICFSELHAQETLPSSGSNASGSGGSASYSVGQMVYTRNTGINGSVGQGVQQPFEIFVVTGLEQAKGINLSCAAYPNPAHDFLKLKIENVDNTNLSYRLYDLNGKVLENNNIKSSETNIDTQDLVPATYFLKILNNDIEIKIFKIIKN